MHCIVALHIVLNFPRPLIFMAFCQFNMSKILAIMKKFIIFFTFIYLAYLHF